MTRASSRWERITTSAGDLPLFRPVAKSNSKWILAVLVALIVLFGVLSPQHSFFSVVNFRGIGEDTSEIVLLAAGMTFIMIAAGIDLSCGSVVVFSAVITGELVANISGTAAQAINLQFPHLALGIVLGVIGGIASVQHGVG